MRKREAVPNRADDDHEGGRHQRANVTGERRHRTFPEHDYRPHQKSDQKQQHAVEDHPPSDGFAHSTHLPESSKVASRVSKVRGDRSPGFFEKTVPML